MGEDYVPQGVASSCEGGQSGCGKEMVYVASYWRSIDDETKQESSIVAELDVANGMQLRRCWKLAGDLEHSHVGGLAYYDGALYVSSAYEGQSSIERYEIPSGGNLRPQKTEDCPPIGLDGDGNVDTKRWAVHASSFVSYATIDGDPSLLVGRYCTLTNCKYDNDDPANPYAYQYRLDANGDLVYEETDSLSWGCNAPSNPASTPVSQRWRKKFRLPDLSQGVDVLHGESGDVLLVSTSGTNITHAQYDLDSAQCARGCSCGVGSAITEVNHARGAEDLALAGGRLWSVSEAGARFFVVTEDWTYYPWVFYTQPVPGEFLAVDAPPPRRSNFVTILESIINAYQNWYDNADRIRPMDVDGDGDQDIVIGPRSDGEWFLLRSEPSGFVDEGSWANEHSGWYDDPERLWVMDIDGDGDDDMVVGPRSDGDWWLMESTPGQVPEVQTTSTAMLTNAYGGWHDNTDRIHIMDVDADGDDDIIIGPQSNGNWYWLEATGGALVDRGKVFDGYDGWYNDSERVWVADVNGDDKQDIVIGPQSNGNWYVLRSDFENGNTFDDLGVVMNKYKNWWNDADRIRVMDVDGDGDDDFVIGPRSDGQWFAALAEGGLLDPDIDPDKRHSWMNDNETGFRAWYNDPERIRVIDVNADGCKDLLIGPKKDTGEWWVLQSDGTKFIVARQWAVDTLEGWYDNTDRIFVMDQNGDGWEDVVVGPYSGGDWHLLRTDYTANDWTSCQ